MLLDSLIILPYEVKAITVGGVRAAWRATPLQNCLPQVYNQERVVGGSLHARLNSQTELYSQNDRSARLVSGNHFQKIAPQEQTYQAKTNHQSGAGSGWGLCAPPVLFLTATGACKKQ